MDNKIKIITHSGSFHPDDCFAVATLLIYLESQPLPTVIMRTRDPEVIKTGNFVVDVGSVYDPDKELFDHHQEDGAGKRDNGIPYASFGLVWKKYGEIISKSSSVAEAFERKLVTPVDAMDNGVEISESPIEDVNSYLVNHVIFSFLPTWKDPEKIDENFLQAVSFAKDLIKRELKILRDKEEGERYVELAYEEAEDKRIIVLDRQYMWVDLVSKLPEPLFVIYPQEDRYHIKAVRSDVASFNTRILFPKEWAGKRDGELAKVTGVEGSVFCHNKRFMAVASSKSDALLLAKKALEQ